MTRMVVRNLLGLGVLLALASCGRPANSPSRGKHVDFSQTDESRNLDTRSYILPRFSITPYRQWNRNNGYCGELSAIQAGMGAGQWMSQYNSRLICGAGLSQSGPNGFCAAYFSPNYNAQFLLEAPNPGDLPFASAPTCLANAKLAFQTYDYARQPSGMAGYRQYMSWVKARLIAGDTVVIGVLNRGGRDPQYDHEVTVSRIGTNHSPTDPTYYEDDVLYFEDHGSGGSSFTQGYTFASLPRTRAEANNSPNSYSILVPGGPRVLSGTGGDGVNNNPNPIVPANYAFAVSGPLDPGNQTLPVSLAILGSRVGNRANSQRPGVGWNFEAPEIGESSGESCTNTAPTWMQIQLQATVSGLTPGVSYSLYEYEITSVSGTGAQAALRVPETAFNANASRASRITQFVAQGSTYMQMVERPSSSVIVFRAVRADAP